MLHINRKRMSKEWSHFTDTDGLDLAYSAILNNL